MYVRIDGEVRFDAALRFYVEVGVDVDVSKEAPVRSCKMKRYLNVACRYPSGGSGGT